MLLLVCPACGSQPSQLAVTQLVLARTALSSGQVSLAEDAFRRVIASDTIVADEVEANIALANVAWRIHRDTAMASARLHQAEVLEPRGTSAFLERSRMEHAMHADSSSLAAGLEALSNARGQSARLAAELAIAASRVEPLIGSAKSPRERRDALAAEMPRLRTLVRGAPGDPRAARLLILAAALSGDGPALLDGWRSYYLVGITDTTGVPLASAHTELKRAVQGWTGDPTDSAVAGIVLALAHARLFEAAAAVATAPTGNNARLATSDPRVAEAVAYERFLQQVQRITDEFYRQTAIGHKNESSWRDSLASEERALWPSLQWPNSPPPFREDRFLAEIGRRFGALMRFSTTASFTDFHFGHVVAEETRDVEQYGHRERLRFIALDEMVSNGFLSWLWDGRSATGGWNAPHTIVQVRPNYAAAPAAAWWSLTDSATRAINDSTIAADSAKDLVVARTAAISYFPSVAKRLVRLGTTNLRDSLAREGLSGIDLQDAFAREYSRSMRESLIAHEGRHAIDRRVGTALRYVWERVTSPHSGPASFDAALEFNAKLSEIAFAPRPQLAFGAIMAPNVGDETGHGSANARLLKDLARWAQRHAAEIPGFDRRTPALIQLPLLTPEQMRTAVRSFDPLGR
jgi:hypothetical protein